MIKTETNLLSGNILKSLLIFAVPMFLSNVFQRLYNTADMVIVGHYLGEASLAAIGASTVIFELLVGFALGVGGGFGLLLHGAAGRGMRICLNVLSPGQSCQVSCWSLSSRLSRAY